MALSALDPHHIIKRVYDPAAEAINVMLPANTSISLDKSEDSIVAGNDSGSYSAAVSPATVLGTELIIEPAAGFFSKAQVYVASPNDVTTGSVKLQVSPADSGDVWADLLTANLAVNNSVVLSGAVQAITARRVRVIANVAPNAAATVYLVLGG